VVEKGDAYVVLGIAGAERWGGGERMEHGPGAAGFTYRLWRH